MLLKNVIRDILSEHSSGRKVGEILMDMGVLTYNELSEVLKIQETQVEKDAIGELLLKKGIISEQDLGKALQLQSGPGESSLLNEITDEAIIEKCGQYGIQKKTLVERLEKKSGLTYIDLSKYVITESMITTRFNIDVLQKNNLILFEIDELNNIMKFASSEIGDTNSIKNHTKSEAIKKGIKCEFYFAFEFEIKNKFNDLVKAEGIEYNESEDGGAVDFVNSIVVDGINKGASDVHIEPRSNGLRVRYRIDGLIAHNETYNVNEAFTKSVISRIKVLAGMDVAVSRKPQDGVIKDFSASGNKYDLRISSIQVVHGEKMVMRIAPKGDTIMSFEELGFKKDDIDKLNSIIHKSNGIFFIAGATGSGKTTTLYSIINALNNPNKNICTIEDPVEREIENINQVQVTSQDSTTALKYSDYLRAFLRQDPDIIIVGETRDRETAETSMRASLTGHLVITTIHANNATETISRLYDMDIDTFILSTTLEGIMSQRLVRKVCTKCSSLRDINDSERQYVEYLSKAEGKEYHLDKIKEGTGCKYCNNTGFRGRSVIAEVITLDSAIKKMISNRQSIAEIENYLKSKGHVGIAGSGLLMVQSGNTTLEELKRVL